MASKWRDRFLSGTRGRVLVLLRGAGRTVNELAAELGLTDNGVRLHLATLERDGLVRMKGTRRGVRKPNFEYELTVDAEQLFPKAYGLLLEQMTAVLATRLSPETLRDLFDDLGQRLAGLIEHPETAASEQEKLTVALQALGALGAVADVERSEAGVAICGRSCPLAALVAVNPDACRIAEVLLSDLLGTPVHEHCDKAALHCRFEIASAA